jgi:hypothetical protein
LRPLIITRATASGARKEASRIFYSLRDPKLRTLILQDQTSNSGRAPG